MRQALHIFPQYKSKEILIVQQTDSYLVPGSLSLQSARLLSSHGELMQGSESSQDKVSEFRDLFLHS